MTSQEDRRAGFAKYKRDVKARGKPFFPYAMFHDTVMSLVVVLVIIALAVIWRYTSVLGPLYEAKADPGTTTFVPRPDWYFYFLFYLLRIFKWPDSVILGTIGIPTILLLILLAMPFLDRSSERRLLRRPVAVLTVILAAVSMGVLTYKGAAAKESLGSENLALVPSWVKNGNLIANAQKLPDAGRERGSSGGGRSAHLRAGRLHELPHVPGRRCLEPRGARPHGRWDRRIKSIKFQIAHLECPSCVNPGSPMPSFKDLGQNNLMRLAVFLESSQGTG